MNAICGENNELMMQRVENLCMTLKCLLESQKWIFVLGEKVQVFKSVCLMCFHSFNSSASCFVSR